MWIGVFGKTPFLTSRDKKMKDNNTTDNNTPKVISGIDTLYYFYESNDMYDDLFLEILDQLEDTKARFEKRDIEYSNKDLSIVMENQQFIFNGKAQGFYWFTHAQHYFTIGFKDCNTNKGLNDIQVQFNAIGIYTLGLKTLLMITDHILRKVVTGHKPLTRVDLNIFVQSDLSWVDKDMFVSRKRLYTTHSKEVSSKYRLQTLYIGRKPFLLRLYDKKEELKNSKKKEMMYEYFCNNGFNSKGDIFNVEFELHREYFKTFKIDTVDDLLSRAELLFQDCLNAIRLVDLSIIPKGAIDSKNKNRALIHPLWQHLNDSYKLIDFHTVNMPLERIKRKSFAYTIESAIKEHLILAKKYVLHGGIIDKQFYDEVLTTMKKSKEYKVMYFESINNNSNRVEVVHEVIHESINIQELDDVELNKYKNMLNSMIEKHELILIEEKVRGIDSEQFPF